MRIETPQHIWHNSWNAGLNARKSADRVNSLDFRPSHAPLRLASAGADEVINIWNVQVPPFGSGEDLSVRLVSQCTGHEKEVNVVRFSPDGSLLASGGEDDSVFIWQPSAERPAVPFGTEEPEEAFSEYWKRVGFHRCFSAVLDLSWCPEGRQIAVATADDYLLILDIETQHGRPVRRLEGHSHRVMGVAWDPLNVHIASAALDRTLRLWCRVGVGKRQQQQQQQLLLKGAGDDGGEGEADQGSSMSQALQQNKWRCHCVCKHAEEKEGSCASTRKKCLFYGERGGGLTFFRRPDWSPDGMLLVAPMGHVATRLDKEEEEPWTKTRAVPCAQVFLRDDFQAGPAVALRASKGCFSVVRFNPHGFAADPSEGEPWLACPKSEDPKELRVENSRFVFACGDVRGGVTVWDTQHSWPLVEASGLHFGSITDAAWSSDCRLLAISSHDGYVTFLVFEEGELGRQVPINPPMAPLKFCRPLRPSLATVDRKEAEGSGGPSAPAVVCVKVKHAVPKSSEEKQGEDARGTTKKRRIIPTVVNNLM